MANLNSANALRFQNGGELLIGADSVKQIVSGTLEWDVPGNEPIQVMDRGVLGEVIAGDERPVKGRLSVMLTSKFWIGTDNLLATLMGALVSGAVRNYSTTTGLVNTFSMTIKQPGGRGVATGTQFVFSNCYLPNGVSYKPAAGNEPDKLEFDFACASASPVITTY